MDINSQSPPELSRRKRRRGRSSPEESSLTVVAASEPKKQVAKIPRGGRRGAALLRAAGVPEPATKGTASTLPRISPRSRSSGKRKASAREPTPKKDPLVMQHLPAKLAALEDIFAAVHTVYDMLRRRGKRTTFGNMKAAVEEASRRRFLESHLSQLQVLLPEVITLDTFSLPVAPHSTRTARNLVLTMAANGDQPAALRAQLHTRLARHLLDSYASFLRTTAAQLRAAGDAVGAEEAEAEAKTAMLQSPLETFRAPYPDAVPDVDMVSAARVVSPQPADIAACVTASASVGGAASSDGHGQATSAAVPVPRRLSFAQADDTSFMVTMPAELRRRSLDGIISVNSLRVLEGNEREYRRFSSQAAHDAREIRAALGALPTTFARLRRIFGPRGPSAMKLDDVVKRIKEGGAELTSAPEIVSQLRCLADHAPEFVELKPWGACGTPAVWINRKCEWNGVAGKLKAVAAGRRESVAGPGVV